MLEPSETNQIIYARSCYSIEILKRKQKIHRYSSYLRRSRYAFWELRCMKQGGQCGFKMAGLNIYKYTDGNAPNYPQFNTSFIFFANAFYLTHKFQ